MYSITQVYTDKTVLSILDIMFINLHSLVMLVAPTSTILLASLSISDVKYTEWIKYIWKLALPLLLVSLSVFMIVNGTLVVGIVSAVLAVLLYVLLVILNK